MADPNRTENSIARLLRGGRWLTSALGPLLALVVVVIGFGVAINRHDPRDSLFSLDGFRVIATETSKLAIPALGMTIIVIAGGIDLSVGMVTSLAAVLMALTLKHGYSPYLAVGVALLTGMSVGAINGMLVSWLRLVPFIATLGMMSVTYGLAKMFAGESGKVVPDFDRIPNWLTRFARVDSDWTIPHVLPAMPVGVWLLLVLAVLTAIILHRTVFGRYVYAIGSNEATARLCGVNVPATKIAIYSLAGLFVGIRGLISFGELSNGDATSGRGLELEVIAAVVIGGSSLNGGRGTVLGTLAGAGIMATVKHGCNMLAVSNSVQDIIIGVAIVAAVIVDQIRQHRANLREAGAAE